MRGLYSNPRATTAIRIACVTLMISALGVMPAAAAQALSLSPDFGPYGTMFDAAYAYTPPSRAACPTDSTVDFWWDAPGPGATNPPGAGLIGEATLEVASCTARTRLPVPATASCGVHTVYAYIDDGRGKPVSGTIASSRFTVTGCPSPSPEPTPRASPKPPPRASIPPTATAPSPTLAESPSPRPSAATAPTPQPSPSPQLLNLPPPSGVAPTPPAGAAPIGPPAGSGDGSLVILAVIGGAALLVVWVGLYLLRLRPAGSGPLLKWGSLGLVLMLVGGGVGLAAQAGGTILDLTVPNWMFPTIQSALDAAPAGANVHIKPGVYHETLFVRKPLQIYGSEEGRGVVIEPPVLPDEGFASTDVVGLINYEDAGGGWLLHVRIDGGQAGVMGLGTTDLVVDDLEVTGSRLGLLWDSAATLTGKDLSIHGTVAAGFMNLKGHHAFEEFGLTFEGGIGMYIANGKANLADIDIEDNDSVGIYIRNAAVTIDGGVIANNNVAGIWAVQSFIDVGPMYIHSNHPDPDQGRFGDGVAVLLGYAELHGVQSSYNDLCGIGAFGATMTLTTTLYQDNLFVACGEALLPSTLSPGLPSVETDFEFIDLGGNYCFKQNVEVTCQVTSPGLEPPEPIPPTT